MIYRNLCTATFMKAKYLHFTGHPCEAGVRSGYVWRFGQKYPGSVGSVLKAIVSRKTLYVLGAFRSSVFFEHKFEGDKRYVTKDELRT